MAERATCAASRNEGFREGVELVATGDPDRFHERMTAVNGLVAGWALLVLALALNLADLYGPGRDHMAFAGLVSAGIALFCVWCGMIAQSPLIRAAWFTWNATAIGVSYVFWLFNHRDLWGIFRNVLS